MSLVHPRFHKILREFSPEGLPQDQTIFGLWPDLALAYFNDGWFRFARDNDGEPRISEEWPLGRSLLDAIPDLLLDFFKAGFHTCLSSRTPWHHEYDCSTPGTYRLLHQTVYPLGDAEGFLAVNSTLVERPMEASGDDSEPHNYVDGNGIIHQCSRCRKVKNLRFAERWDWIPAWIESPPLNVSHGLCPICLSYYYPAVLRERRSRPT